MGNFTVVTEAHDPGGKVRLKLQPGVRGDAIFMGPGDCYRFMLSREWGDPAPVRGTPWIKRYLLSIGMNPSTAAADIDDPTIRWELALCRRLGLERYVKCNVMAYRATNQRDLLTAPVEVAPMANLSTIDAYAIQADKIIVTWGKLPRKLKVHADNVLFRLHDRELWCLGKNKDRSPKHPLYLAADTPLERYR